MAPLFLLIVKCSEKGVFLFLCCKRTKGEICLGKWLRHAVEKRRRELICRLQPYFICQKEEHELDTLSLSELEEEFRRLKKELHPHSELNSIHWSNKSYFS